jgi:uncharacterized protein (TIRG00374 family)
VFVNRRTWATLGLGFAVSGLFLWLALSQVDSKSLVMAFASVNLPFVLASAGALVGGLVLRAVRWRVIAGAPASSSSSFSRATNIGALSNMVLPGRAGEFVRILVLARLSDSRLASPVASALIDRLVDVFVLIASALVLYFLLPLSAVLDKWLTVMVAIGAIATGGLVILAKGVGTLQKLFLRMAGRWLQRWQLRPDIFLMELRTEIRNLLSGWLSIKLMLVSVLVLLADLAAISTLLWAFHLTLPFVATVLLWVFLAAGSSLPSAPGYVGVYQVAAVFALSFFSVPASSAVAIAVVLQVTTLVVTFLMAGPGFLGALKSALAARDLATNK